jgi:hypothetical protein
MVSKKRILHLPPPVGLPRVETGAVQFGDDWPGLFLRGDNALALVIWIQSLCEQLAGHPDQVVMDRLDRLREFADLIKQNVQV